MLFEMTEHNRSLVKAQKVPKRVDTIRIYILLHLFEEFHSTSLYIVQSKCTS